MRLVEDDLVRDAPVELQGDARERDRASVRERAAARIGAGMRVGRSADLAPCELLQMTAARDPREVAVAPREVGRRVERRRSGEEPSGGARRGGASPGRPCCRPSRRRREAATRSHGSVAFATYCMFARSRICPSQPQECSGSTRPCPSGLITANRPRAGRSPQKRRFASPVRPTPVRRDHERERPGCDRARGQPATPRTPDARDRCAPGSEPSRRAPRRAAP